MHLIVCVDDNLGMMFNHRRQSRDRVVSEDIIESLQGRLFIEESAEVLFSDENYIATNIKIENLNEKDSYFIESAISEDLINKVTSITLYRWNRVYPADVYFDKQLLTKFKLISTKELVGYSHECITKESYIREEE